MRQTKQHTTFVIPCYNEQYRLNVAQFSDFLQTTADVSFIFVDDGSRDGTVEILESIRQSVGPNRVEILRLPENRGKAEAIRQGMLLALSPNYRRDREISLVGYLDADLATPLSEAKRLIEVAHRREDIEIVIGSRLGLKGHRVKRTFLRKIVGRIFSIIASRLMGLPVQDTQCGAKLFRVRNWLAPVFRNEFKDRWLFDIEILARVKQLLGADAASKLFEYPLEDWTEVGGSKLKLTDFIRAPLKLIRLVVEYRMKKTIMLNEMESESPVLLPFSNSKTEASHSESQRKAS
ncbi:MAG: glycosyltransferase [Pirellulaceae bacterium]|nr:glycosyltransferase [Pirellulaceae bacterium]